jgi:hypothetical protein
MRDSTPPPSSDAETDQLAVETLDEVAPRLRLFTEGLTDRLRACKLQVATTPVYLLNSTDHPVEVPCTINGVEVQMNFDASFPAWAPDPRARLQVSFNHGRRYFYHEVGKAKAFPMTRILERFLREITACSNADRIQAEKLRKRQNARLALADLGQSLGIPAAQDPDVLRADNVKVRCVHTAPTQVIVMLTVSYDEAAEIVRKYRK